MTPTRTGTINRNFHGHQRPFLDAGSFTRKWRRIFFCVYTINLTPPRAPTPTTPQPHPRLCSHPHSDLHSHPHPIAPLPTLPLPLSALPPTLSGEPRGCGASAAGAGRGQFGVRQGRGVSTFDGRGQQERGVYPDQAVGRALHGIHVRNYECHY